VLSRYVHGLIVRTFDQAEVEQLAKHGSIPDVNALTDFPPPLPDLRRRADDSERWAQGGDLFDSLKGRKIAFLGLLLQRRQLLAARRNLFGMQVAVSGLRATSPAPRSRRSSSSTVGPFATSSPPTAARSRAGADIVYTDVWVSMAREAESADRLKAMAPIR
jgi:ornithine carbamoyltransferase